MKMELKGRALPHTEAAQASKSCFLAAPSSMARVLSEEERARLNEALSRLSELERARLHLEAELRVDEEPRCPLCGRRFVNRHALNVHGGRKHRMPVDSLLAEFYVASLLGVVSG